ncbi:hypothetical protein QTI66_38855 [Variovorax sp. J22R133]|nr:hypothetical protein [Variovorax sp. J22R133]MDM0118042.1 hypothetical protein [Variovorax sp. J22R133]
MSIHMLAVRLPAHQKLVPSPGGNQGRAATLGVLAGTVPIAAPTALLQ